MTNNARTPVLSNRPWTNKGEASWASSCARNIALSMDTQRITVPRRLMPFPQAPIGCMGRPSQYTRHSQPRLSPVIIQAEFHKSGVAPILAEKPESHRKKSQKYQKNPINQTVQEIILGKSPYPNRNSPKRPKKRQNVAVPPATPQCPH
jgi:hypothetical protein